MSGWLVLAALVGIYALVVFVGMCINDWLKANPVVFTVHDDD